MNTSRPKLALDENIPKKIDIQFKSSHNFLYNVFMESESVEYGLIEKQDNNIQLIPEFSAFMGNSILPPSYDAQQRLGIEEFSENYPIRYSIWQELRSLRSDYSQEAQSRLKRLGKYLYVLNALDEYVQTHEENKKIGTQTLWDEQFEVFESLKEGLEAGENDGYIKLPTGTGKTVLFTEFIEALGLQTKIGEPIKSLIVVPSTIPIGQTESALKEFAHDIPFGKVYSEQKDLNEKEKPVTIITDESLQIQINKGAINPLDYDLVVMDEVHKYLSPSKIELFNKFANAIKLGFTATPNYSEEKNVKNLLLPYEYANMTVLEAVEKGMLSSFSAMVAHCDIDISGITTNSETHDYNEKELENKIDITQLNSKVAQFYENTFEEEAGVVFCVGVSHAQHMAESFNEHGIKAAFIHGGMSNVEKNSIKKQYEDGEIQVLCNADILIESFDAPRASVCINLRPTMSSVVAEQRAGRVLRLDKNNPDKHAMIVDFLYSNSNRQAQQILYAEIAKTAEAYGKVQTGSQTRKRKFAERIESLTLEGIDIAIEPEEVLTIVSEQNKLKYIPVPEGWYSLLGITEEIGKISVQKVKKLLEKYRESSPEYFRQFLNPVNSRAFEYVNQKIVDAIKNDLARDTAPTGWVKITDLASEVHRSSPTLLQFIQQIESNEPIAGKFRTQNKGQSAHFVSPEIASKIRSEFSLIERAPDGWKSEIELARELGIDPRTLRKIVDQQVGPNQDGSGIFLNATNIPIRHYSQELIDSLKGTSQLAPKEPGWTTNYSLAREFKVSESTVAETAARLSADHPEWTQIMNKEGSVRRSYNDQLSTLIRIELAERVKTNPEFISANETAALLNLDLNSVNRSLAEIAKTHPELVTVQRSKSGQLTPHIHQDALKMIEAHREKPKGYFSLQEASRLLGRHPATTEKYARRVAAEKFPDGIVEKPIIGTEKSEVYIKPEILEEIEVELAKFQPAPEGWISFAQFRKNTGHSTKWIENRLAQLKALHPQGVGKYYDSLNRPIDFFSPEAVKYLEEFEGTK